MMALLHQRRKKKKKKKKKKKTVDRNAHTCACGGRVVSSSSGSNNSRGRLRGSHDPIFTVAACIPALQVYATNLSTTFQMTSGNPLVDGFMPTSGTSKAGVAAFNPSIGADSSDGRRRSAQSWARATCSKGLRAGRYRSMVKP